MKEFDDVVLALLLGTLGTGCKTANPDYCDANSDCTDGLICHVPSHACIVPADASNEDSPVPDARLCFGPTSFEVCLRALPTESVVLPSFVNTDQNSDLCSADQLWQNLEQKDTCFVVGTTITVPNTRVEGTRQLVLLATATVDVIGYVDASAHSYPYIAGPGVSVGCAQYARFPEDGNGAGGGAGGTFGTGGGDGGSGGGDGTFPDGGQKAPVLAPPLILHGGCHGQTGGNGPGNAGNGGGGGGALYFAAGATIHLGPTAIINVSGAGGTPAGKSCGGGGGGSGGMLLLDAPNIVVEAGAKIVANGGGGSSGGSSTSMGVAGADPDPTTPFVPATGGMGAGAAGGHGGSQTVASESGRNALLGTDGGGGGGGGLGYVRANHALTNAEISPEPHIVP